MPFQESPFLLQSLDGRNFVLAEEAIYTSNDGTQYQMPIGATTDGASTPPILWQAFGKEWLPPFGSYWRAAVLHDCAYRNTLLMHTTDGWVVANLSKECCDSLLKEAMESLGTHNLSIEEIYKGVVDAGQSSFDGDRKLHP